jgi:hypothetical protein
MNKQNSVLLLALVLAASASALAACSEDSSSSNTSSVNPFSPPANTDSGAPSSSGGPEAGPGTDGGACSGKPAGCFCGTPTTQAQFLNRCTNATALPVIATVKAATTADIP